MRSLIFVLVASWVTAAAALAAQPYQFFLDRGSRAQNETPPPPRAEPAAVPAQRTVAPIAQRTDVAMWEGPLFRVTKEAMQTGMVNGDFIYRIRIDARTHLANVRIHEQLPFGVNFVRANPTENSKTTDTVRWEIDRMPAGSHRTFEVVVSPSREGNFDTCTIVTADPVVCLTMQAGQARLTVEKNGPLELELNQTATFVITVNNVGSAPARNVRIDDNMPTGMTAVSPTSETVDVIHPGQSRTLRVQARATQTGQFTNSVIVSAPGLDTQQAEHRFSVVRSGVDLGMRATEQQFVFGNANHDLIVRNTGDVTLTDLQLAHHLPAGVELRDPGAGRVAGRTITWSIPTLLPGEERMFSVALTANTPVTVTTTGEIRTQRGLSDTAEASTRFVAAPGLKSTIIDDADPVRIGDVVTYTIEITNQGQFEATSVLGEIHLSPELQFIEARGPINFTLEGSTIRMTEMNIAPRRTIRVEVRARAIQSGVGRATFRYTSEFLREPVTAQESTFIY